MATYTRVSELSNLLENKGISEKTHLLLINKNLQKLQAQIRLFSKFESHITAVSNSQDAIYVLKKGDFDLIVNDNHVLKINNKIFSRMIKKRNSEKPLFIINASYLSART